MDATQPGGMMLADYLRIAWKRRLLIAVITLGMVVPAVLVSRAQTPVYEASATLSLSQQRLDGSFNTQFSDLTDSQMATQSMIVNGDEVTRLAAARGAVATVEVETPPASNILVMKARSHNPDTAAISANAYAKAFTEYQSEQVRAAIDGGKQQIDTRIDILQGQIDRLNSQASGEGGSGSKALARTLQAGLREQQASLQGQLGQLQVQRKLASGATLISEAMAPTEPTSPQPVRDGLLALVIGLALGLSIAVIRETSRRTASSSEPRRAWGGRRSRRRRRGQIDLEPPGVSELLLTGKP